MYFQPQQVQDSNFGSLSWGRWIIISKIISYGFVNFLLEQYMLIIVELQDSDDS